MNKALRVPDYLGHILQAVKWQSIRNDLPALYNQVKAVLG